jgi:cytochrome oxidase Cu insertion factor (SCO1/SenC/PrrC family)
MPLNMANQIVQPTAHASPGWVDHLVNFGITIWNNHPVTAASAAFWIQIGVAIWLLTASRGLWSRAGGLVSAAWGLGVWIFGESFGGLFAPGYSWLFGAPGAVLLYAIVGVFLALPDQVWTNARLGLWTLRTVGAFTLIMGIVQAWPGRGFWQGQSHPSSAPGTLTGMVQSMAQTSQPHLFSSPVRNFAQFDASHGWGVNLFAVVVLIVLGLAFVGATVRDQRVRTGFGRLPLLAFVVIFGVICVADWILVQDLGFFGGLGTDPNSMVPFIVFVSGSYLWVAHPATALENIATFRLARSLPTLSALRSYVGLQPNQSLRSFAAGGALFITVFGAIPVGVAAFNPMADSIISQAVDGTPAAEVRPAPNFTFINELNHRVSLTQFKGKTVVLTFLDPVCISDCPIIGQEIRQTDLLLGAAASQVEFVAINANPLYRSTAYTTAFSTQEGLNSFTNWQFLTGSLPSLQSIWTQYGVTVSYYGPGSMIAHNDIMYVIGSDGQIHYIINSDPGSGTRVTESSFENTLLSTINAVKG